MFGQFRDSVLGVNTVSYVKEMSSFCNLKAPPRFRWATESVDLYNLDHFLTKVITDPDRFPTLPESVRREVLGPKKADVAPAKFLSLAEFLNPDGAPVNLFISHWWGGDTLKMRSAVEHYAWANGARGRPLLVDMCLLQ